MDVLAPQVISGLNTNTTSAAAAPTILQLASLWGIRWDIPLNTLDSKDPS